MNWNEIREIYSWLPPSSEGYHQHPNGGGWVSDDSVVCSCSQVGADCVVDGGSWVEGGSWVTGGSFVTGGSWVTNGSRVIDSIVTRSVVSDERVKGQTIDGRPNKRGQK